MTGEGEKEKSVYHLDLVPGKEERRPEWGLIFVSDVAVGVDFHHTDMIEKVVIITGVKRNPEEEEEKEEIGRKELNDIRQKIRRDG